MRILFTNKFKKIPQKTNRLFMLRLASLLKRKYHHMKTFTLGTSKSQVLEMIPAHAIHEAHLEERVIALVRIGENFHAFQAECPHRGTSLI